MPAVSTLLKVVRPHAASGLAWHRLPVGLGALTIAGALLGHEVGYLTDPATRGHGYLDIATPLALIAIVATVWRIAINIVSAADEKLPSFAVLAGSQTGLYLAFEIGERLVGDTGSSLASVPVLAGLVAQPLVAWVALRILDIGQEILAAVVARTVPTAMTFTAAFSFAIASLVAAAPIGVVAARGPPRSF